MLIDPNEKVFEAGGYVLQIGKDSILYVEGRREEARDKDKVFFHDIDRITVLRNKGTGQVCAIDYKVKGRSGSFEIGDYTEMEMEEIANLLKSRARGFPIKFLEKQGDPITYSRFAVYVFVFVVIAVICVAAYRVLS
jgi:hypothetical protein